MTILEKALYELRGLKENLAPGDLTKCAKEIGITKGSLSLYMNKKGGNPDTALKALTYLRKVVNERKKSIA